MESSLRFQGIKGKHILSTNLYRPPPLGFGKIQLFGSFFKASLKGLSLSGIANKKSFDRYKSVIKECITKGELIVFVSPDCLGLAVVVHA